MGLYACLGEIETKFGEVETKFIRFFPPLELSPISIPDARYMDIGRGLRRVEHPAYTP
jgi:hypothetical protein